MIIIKVGISLPLWLPGASVGLGELGHVGERFDSQELISPPQNLVCLKGAAGVE